MTRILAISVALFLLATVCTSCMDQEPGEVTIRPFKAGQPVDCTVKVYNDKGVQIQEDSTERQFTYIKGLKPGTYYVKLKDYSGTEYKAIRKFTIRGGDAKVEDIDVDDVSKNPAELPGELAAAPPA